MYVNVEFICFKNSAQHMTIYKMDKQGPTV